MIESVITYDLLPDFDESAYWDFVKKFASTALKTPHVVEYRAHRNLLGRSQVRATIVWESLQDCASYLESEERQMLDLELRKFAWNIKTEIWVPSPYLPEDTPWFLHEKARD